MSGHDNFPRMHPREMIVRQAGNEHGTLFLDLMRKHDLTLTEAVSILHGEIGQQLKYLMRLDRHGDTSTPSGLMKDKPEPEHDANDPKKHHFEPRLPGSNVCEMCGQLKGKHKEGGP